MLQIEKIITYAQRLKNFLEEENYHKNNISIFINQLKLEQEQEEAGQAYVTLSSTIEAFYQILVLDKNIISRETFDEVASKILSDNVNAITEYLEQQESK